MSVEFEGGGIKSRFGLRDCVGREVYCEDGIRRKVVNIQYSHFYKWRAVINETDPEKHDGHFVHLLELSCNMLGKPRPDKDQMEAFKRFVCGIGFQQDEGQSAIERAAQNLRNKGLWLPK